MVLIEVAVILSIAPIDFGPHKPNIASAKAAASDVLLSSMTFNRPEVAYRYLTWGFNLIVGFSIVAVCLAQLAGRTS